MKNYLIVLTLLFLSSCSDEKTDTNVQQYAEPHERLILNINSQNKNFDVWYGVSTAQENKDYALLIDKKRYSNIELKTHLNDLKFTIPENELKRILGHIIYVNKFYKNDEELLANHVSGLLIYYVDDKDNLGTLSFEKKNSKIQNISDLSVKIKNIAFDDIYSISQFFSKNQKTSAIVTLNKSIYSEKSWNSKRFDKVINKFKKKSSNPNNELLANDCDSPCSFPCDDNPISGNRCVIQEKPGGGNERYICSCFCAVEAVNELTPTKDLDESDLYSFRDYFLNNPQKGQTYIQHYYEFSEHFSGNISISEAINIATLGESIIPKLKYFYNNQQNNLILYDNNLRDDLINVINDFKLKQMIHL
jgi:hypothetical protein